MNPGQQPQQGMPNGYDMNPMMMEALGDITPDQLPMFLMGNPEMVPAAYSKKIHKSLMNLASYVTLGVIAGSVANVQIKRVYLNFLKWPIYARLPVRLAVFALPFGAMYPKINSNF